MKLGKCLIYSFICLFLAGCEYCPSVWTWMSYKSFTFTLDKYEARIGDEITIDTGDIKAFDSEIVEVFFKAPDDQDNKGNSYLEIVKKINSSKAVFKIGKDAFSGTVEISCGIKEEVQEGCSTNYVMYDEGKSDKELKIIK